MDHSFRDDQGSAMQHDQDPQSFGTNLPILAKLINWLTDLFRWTKEEQEDAGVYIERLGDE